MVSLPRRPIVCRRDDQNAADVSKIFRRRVQGFRRRVQNISPTLPRISPTRPKYFADASKDFAEASRDFTADVVTLSTRPVTLRTRLDPFVLKFSLTQVNTCHSTKEDRMFNPSILPHGYHHLAPFTYTILMFRLCYVHLPIGLCTSI